ncbi:anti-sigma factor [Uliginosibacterium sp. H3]|uniref:Anti-sigma factor n=1 Tax=Uliginosibacterium silvisoli TaxID=3114758 RepID=A0ABU6K8X5_9RHOO|nr:anti-sigma factor [Uliginosibacterium sp. H3]
MSDATDKPGNEDIDTLASEYVLGTLSAAARRDVETRMASEPALRAAVDAWETRLQPLTSLAAPADPSPALWPRIERSLGFTQASRPASSTSSLGNWWNNLHLWRGLALTGFAAALALAVALHTQLGTPAGPQYLIVLVAPQDKAPGWVVQANATQELSLIPLGTAVVPASKSLQFWTKADGWSGPVSLGLVKPGETRRITLDKLPPLQPNQLFELTLEPENGSPIGRPTGPIQFIGRAVKVRG